MKIEQVLHGYSDGHQLLASSTTTLSPSDRRKMALLSDWNEYVSAQDDDSSYLTCYPLPDSPYFVVAKTWYADEKERPGCVWTHSLLIDIQGQSSFFDFELLYSLFRRPKEGVYGSYEESLETDENAQRELMSGEYDDMPSLDYWLWQMLANNVPLMLTYQGNSLKSQQLVLSLMNHIPKAMLRGMSFCSGTGRLMKYDGVAFDFQLTSEARRNIPKLNGCVSEGGKAEGWYKTIADSIVQDGIDIPMLITRFSDEIGIRNEALGAVVLVFSLVDRLKEPGDGNEQKFQLALRIIATAFPEKEQGERFKSVMLAENVTRYFFGEEHFIYQMVVTPYWHAFDYESFKYKERVRAYVSSKEISVYASLMTDIINSQSDNPVKTETLMQTVREYSEEDCELLMTDYWNYYLYLAQRDSRMLNCKAWMSLDREKFLKLIQLFKNNVPSDFKYWDVLQTKMLWEDVPVDQEIITEIGRHIDTTVNEILNRMSFEYHVGNSWIAYCKSEPVKVMMWMKEKFSLNRALVRLVLDMFDPRSELVRNSETSVWACMLSADVDNEMVLEYSTFLFVLSYNLRCDDYAFSYYQKSFLPIYEATAENRIDNYWMEIGPYCPRPFWGWEWDRCDMLRKGFAERVFNEDRGAKTARKFTTKSSLNKKLYKLVQKKYQG